MSDYVKYCEEHDLPLYPDGSCPLCFCDGKRFTLDMQSTYLLRKGSPEPKPRVEGYPE